MPNDKGMSKREEDFALMRRIQNDDQTAFAELYKKYKSRLIVYVRKKCWAEDIEAIVDDSLARAYRYRHTFRYDASVATWLHAITDNVRISLMAKRDKSEDALDKPEQKTSRSNLKNQRIVKDESIPLRSVSPIDIDKVPDDGQTIWAGKDWSKLQVQSLRARIKKLPDEFREVIELYRRGIPHKDIALQLGISESI